MQLHAIREARAARVAEARSLLASMPTLTPEAHTAFDKIKATITDLEGQEARAQFIEDAERRAVGAPVANTAPPTPAPTPHPRPPDPPSSTRATVATCGTCS